MFILYAYDGKAWQAFAKIEDKKNNYEERVLQTSEKKMATGKTEEIKNAALVMRAFVCEEKYFDTKTCGKTVKRALRHFDEVGISNDIYESLEELLDEGFASFALAKDTQDISAFSLGEITVKI